MHGAIEKKRKRFFSLVKCAHFVFWEEKIMVTCTCAILIIRSVGVEKASTFTAR
jgi:hypothetical protein